VKLISSLLVILFITLQVIPEESTDSQLLFAVQALNIEKARQAIRNGANVNGIDEDGWPLFISAVNSENEGMINLFLRSGAKVDVTGPDGKTALMHSLSSKKTKIAEWLIKSGASMTVKDSSGKTVLMYAAEAEYEPIIKKAISAKADVYARDKKGWNALNYAMNGRNKNIIKLLGQYETKPTDFLIALENGDTIKVRTMLRQGMDPNFKNENGEPAIFVAIKSNDRIMLKLLLEYNADVNFKNSKGYTILMYCLSAGKIELAMELLKYGALADFNYKYAEGKTALMIAILSKDRRFFQSIVKFRQDVNLRDDYGNTALMYAAGMGIGDLVKTLLEKGAKKDIQRKDGRTALDIAKAKGYAYVTKLLE